MTSAHSMRTCAPSRWAARLVLAASALSCAALASCSVEPKLVPPIALGSPYEQQQIWAVVPFVNESGVSIVAGDRIADAFVREAESVRGIDTLPVNRVIAAMRRLGLAAVTTPAQANLLLKSLGADGLIVGTVTLYDPYQPPRFGAAVALFTADRVYGPTIDPVQATRSRTDTTPPDSQRTDAPIAQASGVFDASNHETLQQLDDYAAGRTEPASAFGRRIYLVRMEMYTQFAAHRLLHDLLASEQARLLPMHAEVQSGGEGMEEPDSSR